MPPIRLLMFSAHSPPLTCSNLTHDGDRKIMLTLNGYKKKKTYPYWGQNFEKLIMGAYVYYDI